MKSIPFTRSIRPAFGAWLGTGLLAIALTAAGQPPTTIPAIAAAEAPAPEPPEPPEPGATIERTVRSAMREAEKAMARAAEVGKSVAIRLASSGRPSTLVLPGAGMSTADADALGEDLAVMGRIFQKSIGRSEVDHRLWLGGLGGPFGRDLDALYLDGFGALFLLNVEFPLVPPAEVKPAKENEPADRTWEETRRELKEGPLGPGPRIRWSDRRFEGGPEFEAGRVEELKGSLIKALRHAANLGGVRENESVAVTVFGPAPRGEIRVAKARRKGTNPSEDQAGVSVEDLDVSWVGEAEGGPGARNASVMTLRAKKSDIDAVSKGRMTPEAFGRAVQISVR